MTLSWFKTPGPLVLGHRGASAFAPENTMAAFELAIQQGAVGVEFDVQLSRDGVPVIIHDDTVDRTTDGSGTVTELSLAELKMLDAGNGEAIPTLAEFLDHFGDRILYNLEIKNADTEDKGAEKAILATLDQFELAGNVLISSFNPLALQRIQQQASDRWPVAYLWVSTPTTELRQTLHATADHPYYKLIDEEYLTWARAANLLVNTWTVDDPVEAAQLVALGVHGIITNQPGAMKL